MHAALARRLAEGDERFAVTGATGWFGRVTLDLLAAALGPDAFRARVRAYASRARSIDVAGAGTVEARPLAALEPAEIVAHYAFLTKDRAAQGDFLERNLAITGAVLDAVASGGVRGLVYTSSGAARRPDVAENPYGALKRLDELAFAEACRQAGAAFVCARVFNVGGAHMTKPELYALGDLILSARRDEPLRVRARGPVLRSFVAVTDVVEVALGEALDGRDAFFETAGERTVDVADLADEVRRALGRPELPIEVAEPRDGPEDRYVGDGTALRAIAARRGLALRRLPELIRDTAESLP